MEILMIGHSGVGKTSFLAAMYQQLSKGTSGFTVESSTLAEHRELLRLGNELKQGRYPDPSDQRSSYNFRLHHRSGPVIDFVWRDYRGGALLERTDSSSQARQLHEDLDRADAIVAFATAPDIVGGNRRDDLRTARVASVIKRSFLQRDRPGALAVVMTKTDLVDDPSSLPLKPGAFESLLDAVEQSEHLIGTVIPVACGRRFLNVSDPVLFCVACGVILAIEVGEDRLFELEQRARGHSQRNTFFNRLSSAVFDYESEESKFIRTMEQFRSEYDEIASLLEPAERLMDRLDKYPIFVSDDN